MVSNTFTLADYILLILTLSLSSLIGIFFGCFGSKQKTATEYLFGKGNIKAIPVGLSLFSSAVSTVTVVGAPGEMYAFGSQFVMAYFGILLSFLITWYFILPVFCDNNQISTPYQYFELRFNYKIRVLSAVIYIIHALLYMPVVLYASVVSFSEASQISVTICTTIVGGVCIFYTMLGGFSAVIWSDALQATLLIASCTLIMIKGIFSIGSVTEIFHRVHLGDRLQFFDMDLNPFKRLTFWSATIGMLFLYPAHSGCSAGAIQRYMALKNEKQARISTFVGCFGHAIVGLIVSMIGLTMFAQYYGCDPVKNQDVNGYNKLLSYYVMHTLKDIPGFAGFFMAGILCAGLSTISAELNTVSGLIYHDFIKRNYKNPINETKGAIIMKVIVAIIGIYCLVLAPVLEKSEHLAGFALIINGLTHGVVLGIMILGTTFPRSNSIGVFIGSVFGIITTAWLSYGAISYDVNALYVKPLFINKCTTNNFTNILNMTTLAPILENKNYVPLIYKFSYMYYVPFGTIITIVISLIVSYLTRKYKTKDIHPNMFIPWVRPKIDKKRVYENIHMLPQEEEQ